MEGVTSLAVLTYGSAFGVEKDVLLRCFFIVRSIDHHKTIVMQSLRRSTEVESMKCDLAETKRFLTADKELTADLAESYGRRWRSARRAGPRGVRLGNLARHVRVTTLLLRCFHRYAWCT